MNALPWLSPAKNTSPNVTPTKALPRDADPFIVSAVVDWYYCSPAASRNHAATHCNPSSCEESQYSTVKQTMAPYFGLTGGKLHAAVWVESLCAIAIFGYCSASAGGVLNMPSFEAQFPGIDVSNAPASEAHHRSTIQGPHRILV